MRGQRWILFFGLAVLLPPSFVSSQSQQPPPPSSPAPATQPVETDSSSNNKRSSRHQQDFLIKGTVFTQEGLSFAGAQIQIRRDGDKSFRWKGQANSRGEFAIRVIMGSKYVVVAKAKGCKDQIKPADATGNERIQEMVFRMEREGGKPS